MCFFFYICTLFSGSRGPFLALSATEHAWGPPVHRRQLGSRAGSVARAVGIQSREIEQVITGLLSAELEPSKAMENPHVSCESSLLGGSHGTRAVAHQVIVGYYDARVDVACACVFYAIIRLRVFRCVRVCALVRWNPTFQILFFSSAFAAAAGAVSCRLYHTVPQALKLSTWWRPRHSSSRTVSLRRPLLITYHACADIACACVLCDLWACV